MAEIIAVRIATLRALIFDHGPRITVTIGGLFCAAFLDSVVGQESPAEQCMSLIACM